MTVKCRAAGQRERNDRQPWHSATQRRSLITAVMSENSERRPHDEGGVHNRKELRDALIDHRRGDTFERRAVRAHDVVA